MAGKPGYRWNLRLLMAEHGMFATTDLVAPLAERGVSLSSVQVYRLVTGTPERLNLGVLAALCDIFGVTPNELIIVGADVEMKKAAGAERQPRGGRAAPDKRPVRARILPDAP